jgi:hypothetical protein
MRVMAGEAGESSVTVAKTGGAVEIPRLVTNVPGICPVAIVIQIACLAMACSTKGTDLDGGQPLGVLYGFPASRFGMRASRPVAGFAVNARLAGLHLEVGRERQWSGRVTAKTT